MTPREALLVWAHRQRVPIDESLTKMHYEPGRVPAPQSVASLAHEVAHWLVSSPRRRAIVNYGLGPGPDSYAVVGVDYVWPHEIHVRRADEEEERASLLGIALEAHVGAPFEETLEDHSWGDSSPEKVRDKLRRLVRRGLLRGVSSATIQRVMDAHRVLWQKINENRSKTA